MTAPAAARTRNSLSPGALSQATTLSGTHKYGVTEVNYSPENARPREILRDKIGRRLIARLLWSAFPECHSEEQVALEAAKVLGMDHRHIRRLLDCEHAVNIDAALAVMTLAGFEAAMTAYRSLIK